MDIAQAIRSRRTVRDFQDKPIGRATLARIVDAGLRAPSNDHMRNWEFVVVDSLTRRLELLARVRPDFTADEVNTWLDGWGSTDPVQRAMYLDGVPKQHRMLFGAGALLIPCFRQASPLLQPRSLSELNAFASMWCCIENMLLAAVAEGIFGVTRIPFPEEVGHVRQTLGIPSDYEVACYLALGYPTPNAVKPIQFEPEATDRLHSDHW